MKIMLGNKIAITTDIHRQQFERVIQVESILGWSIEKEMFSKIRGKLKTTHENIRTLKRETSIILKLFFCFRQ